MATDSFGDFTCYFRGAFFGRDAGSTQKTLRNGKQRPSHGVRRRG